MFPIVAYYRVSTAEQGRSGLGLEAQRAAVAAFAKAEGFEIVAEFTEVETGKGADALDRRPAAEGGAEGGEEGEVRRSPSPSSTGSVARRRVHRGLMAQKVPFIVARAGPQRRSVHAAHLRRARRAGAADDLASAPAPGLQAAKARGVKLGNPALAAKNAAAAAARDEALRSDARAHGRHAFARHRAVADREGHRAAARRGLVLPDRAAHHGAPRPPEIGSRVMSHFLRRLRGEDDVCFRG